MGNLRSSLAAATIFIFITILAALALPAFGSPPPVSSEPKAGLRQLDFKVTGSDCPVCVRSIQNILRNEKGVIKGAVMLKSPFAGVVIYDAGKTGYSRMFQQVKAKYPKVKIVKIDDKSIARMPPILIPRGITGGEEKMIYTPKTN